MRQRFAWLMLPVVLLGTIAAEAQDTSRYQGLIQAFLQRPEEMQKQSHALGEAWGHAAHACDKIDVADDYLTYLTPITFDDNGTPASGTWKETVESKGCGQTRALNLFFVAGPTEVMRFPGAPGSTRADPRLQQDSVRYLLAGAAPYLPKACDLIQLIDTVYVGVEGAPISGGKSAPWQEHWTVAGCNVGAQVTLHFIPDATGTTIDVRPAETKRVDVN
jgi:hypothetical protein